jgi:superoxide dismutase, Cu-Zn family
MYRTTCLMAACSFLLVACETSTTAAPMEREWQAVLQGEAGWEHLSGSAVVVAVPGVAPFAATMELSGDEPGAVRPWHVHVNSCAQGGGIVGQDGDYPRLSVGAGGTATATVTVAQALSAGASYHVNVHRADDDLPTIIACGDLVLAN